MGVGFAFLFYVAALAFMAIPACLAGAGIGALLRSRRGFCLNRRWLLVFFFERFYGVGVDIEKAAAFCCLVKAVAGMEKESDTCIT